jgi:hypothetical protein
MLEKEQIVERNATPMPDAVIHQRPNRRTLSQPSNPRSETVLESALEPVGRSR